MQKFVLITETDIFGKEQKKKKRKKTQYSGEKIHSFAELSVGDYVVHENHGLGIYRGIEKVEVDHVVKDYMKIEYSGGSNLYIQATQLDVLQKYAGSDAKKPKLNKLGSQEWNKTKSRVRGAVANIAKGAGGPSTPPGRRSRDTSTGRIRCGRGSLRSCFPFEETEDQTAAIEATKADMEKPQDHGPADLRGCGLRQNRDRHPGQPSRRFRKISRWCSWCPPPSLAQQHYNTFVQRMKDFPGAH